MRKSFGYLEGLDAAHSDHGFAAELAVVPAADVHGGSVELLFGQQHVQKQHWLLEVGVLAHTLDHVRVEHVTPTLEL